MLSLYLVKSNFKNSRKSAANAIAVNDKIFVPALSPNKTNVVILRSLLLKQIIIDKIFPMIPIEQNAIINTANDLLTLSVL
jgi:hypothetical protein